MLRVDDIHTFYGRSHVLQGVSLRVAPGELVCLLGRNGAGKTTTIHSIVGFLRPKGGTIRFDGADVTRWPTHARARRGLGLVPQGRRLFPLLTVEENLTIGARGGGEGWTMETVYRLFPRLKERRGNLSSQLSGGEQKMLAIGRALLSNPKLLLLDEPSEGLAPMLVEETYAVIDGLKRQGLAILLVEHSLDQALALSDRAYVMSKGRIVLETADPAAISDTVRQQLLGVG